MAATEDTNGVAATSTEQGKKNGRKTKSRKADKPNFPLDHAENQGGNNNAVDGDNSGRACAACSVNRKGCNSDCVLRSHFPSTMKEQYKQVQEVFGQDKTKKLLADAEEKKGDKNIEDTVNSILWESQRWKDDPIGGPYAFYQKLERDYQILQLNNERLLAENNRLISNEFLRALSNNMKYGLQGQCAGGYTGIPAAGDVNCVYNGNGNVNEGNNTGGGGGGVGLINNSNINFNVFQTGGSLSGGGHTSSASDIFNEVNDLEHVIDPHQPSSFFHAATATW